MTSRAIAGWHRFVETRDPAVLDGLLHEDVVFESPVVHTPQRGKAITTGYLTAAMDVLGNPGFRYVGEWISSGSGILEFVCEIDGIAINGVDMIRWDDDGRIIGFKVMVRPLKAINLLHQKMAERLMRTG